MESDGFAVLPLIVFILIYLWIRRRRRKRKASIKPSRRPRKDWKNSPSFGTTEFEDVENGAIVSMTEAMQEKWEDKSEHFLYFAQGDEEYFNVIDDGRLRKEAELDWGVEDYFEYRGETEEDWGLHPETSRRLRERNIRLQCSYILFCEMDGNRVRKVVERATGEWSAGKKKRKLKGVNHFGDWLHAWNEELFFETIQGVENEVAEELGEEYLRWAHPEDYEDEDDLVEEGKEKK